MNFGIAFFAVALFTAQDAEIEKRLSSLVEAKDAEKVSVASGKPVANSFDTSWSQSQAAALYGAVVSYRETGSAVFLKTARELADYAMANPLLPPDGVPHLKRDKEKVYDVTSPLVTATGLLELSRYVETASADKYKAHAIKLLDTLLSEKHIDSVRGNPYLAQAAHMLGAIKNDNEFASSVACDLPAKACLPVPDWKNIAATVAAGDFLKNAETYLSTPVEDTEDRLYLQFRETGNRSNYQKPYHARLTRLVNLTVAEAMERKGRFMPKLVETIDAICAMKSWVLPAHDDTDGGNGNFRETTFSVDLFASQLASHLAYASFWLKDDLPPGTVAKIKDNCERRIFAPLRRSVSLMTPDGKLVPRPNDRPHWWLSGDNNWNAVCYDNYVTAAFGLLDDKTERALVLATALRGIGLYVKHAFEEDGYCTEGMGYWNYGFGHYLMLGLLLRDTTDGKIDIFKDPKLHKIAKYPYGYLLEEGVSPMFADGNGVPSPANLALVRRVWPDLTCEAAEGVSPFGTRAQGVAGVYFDHYAALLGTGRVPPPSGKNDEALPLRSVFPAGQVFLMRAGKDISVAVKGGTNAEHHNHNDVGTYSIVSNGKLLAGDAGREEYTRFTFSVHRYKSKILNSYGHPVPVVGGALQPEGARYRAKVLKTDFTDEKDVVVLDLTAAYKCETLKSIVRTCTFDRKAKTFAVRDRVEFTAPTEFEDAYTTFEGEDFGNVGVKVNVVEGGATETRVEKIPNGRYPSPVRHGIKFSKPVLAAEIEMVFVPER